MYVVHSHLTFPAEAGPGFEAKALESRSSDGIGSAPGFIRRMLLRDEDHPGEYFYISMWASEELHHAYQRQRMAQLEVEGAAAAAAGEAPAPAPVMDRRVTTTVFEDVPRPSA